MATHSEKKCTDCNKNSKTLTGHEISQYLAKMPGWEYLELKNEINKTFEFSNYHRTMAFVNAVAWIAHQNKHHPDLCVHYNRCVVHYTTHDAGGVTENDIICAAKIDTLFNL